MEHRVVSVLEVAVAAAESVVAVDVVAIISFADDTEAFVGQLVSTGTVDGVEQQRMVMHYHYLPKYIEPSRYLPGFHNWRVDLEIVVVVVAEIVVVAEKKMLQVY